VEESEIEQAAPRLDANLRKARLAVDAEILTYPFEQSALFYYSQILEADPDHDVARAELETVLGKIALTVSDHMLAEDYSNAYELAILVARKNPGHPLVEEVTRELDRLTNAYVDQAIQQAQDGSDDEVTETLALAEGLPGRNPDYFSAVRESIANIQESRLAEEQSQLERVRLASVQATTAWVKKVRDAIAAGRLIFPAGSSAVDYLAERDSPAADKAALTSELIDALMSECAERMEAGSLDEAELFLAAATGYVGDTAETDELRNRLEASYLDSESERVLTVDNFNRLNSAPARYPRRALERNVEGWVDVLFTVTTSGDTADITVQAAEPSNFFENAATEAVSKWTFEPRVFRGQAIDQRAGARLVFRLE
jgi:TonB family protein